MSIANRVRMGEVTLLSKNWGKLSKYQFEYRRNDGSWQA